MQFALLISVVVALLLSAFLLLTHVQSFFKIKSHEILNASDATTNQILKSLEDSSIQKDTLILQENSKTQKLASSYLGAWTKIYSEINIHNRSVSKTALIGSVTQEKSPNLYLANTNSPLVVVGDTRLEGNSYLPKQGVKAGNISGNYYQGSSLYYGRVIESKETLPKLDPKWIAYLESITKGILVDEAYSIPLGKDIKNTFYKHHKIIYNPSTIVLGDEKITGNIIIQSGTHIVINSATRLEGVMLLAPNITINDNVQGNIQAIATKKLKVGKRCNLSYPSSLVLLDKNITPTNEQGNTTQNRELNFTIGNNTLIEGSVVYLKKQADTQNRIKTNLKIEPGSEIIGEVYCQGNIDFEGIVSGAMYTRQFIANQSGSIYLNHIYNAKILHNPIPDYAGLPFVNSKNSIAKWLY